MSAEYVRRYYAVDFKVGERVSVDGRPGVIVSFPGQYLGVRFDGERHTSRCHPTWRVERQPATRRCPRVDAHEPHGWTVGLHIVDGKLQSKVDYRCPGFVVVEGGAFCEEHQAAVADCRYRHEVERRARWAE